MEYETIQLDDGTVVDSLTLDARSMRDLREGAFTLALRSVRVEGGAVRVVVDSTVHATLGETTLTLEASRRILHGIPVADVTRSVVNIALADASAAACEILKTVESGEWNRA